MTDGAGQLEDGGTLLDGIAAIVVPNCAVSGCHDAQTKEHGMDLSTTANIYDAWVNRKGLDHGRNALRVRVVPGAPDESYVMVKILGAETCDLSQRMPSPPRMALSAEQIEFIRAWIGAGAPRGHVDAGATADVSESDEATDRRFDGDDVSLDQTVDNAADAEEEGDEDANVTDTIGERDGAPNDVGPGPADVLPPLDATACPEGGSLKALRARRPSGALQIECTPTKPCPAGMSCMGTACDDVWECYAHAEFPGQHPCPDDYAPYCGCDGVTFMALRTCPDRPYERESACEDGVSCDPSALRCSGAAPSCPEGQVPSVVDGRYGKCVPFGFCRCESDVQCPHRDKYKCDPATSRCQMLPIDP